MHTFRTLERQIGMVPAPMTVSLRAIDQAQGSERAFSLQHPEALRTLIQIARIQSVEASNAIEDVTAPHARVVDLVEGKTTPQNRSEAEIAGYRSVPALGHRDGRARLLSHRLLSHPPHTYRSPATLARWR